MIITIEEIRKLKTIPKYKFKQIHVSKHGNFICKNITYMYAGICKREGCDNHFLTLKYRPGLYCSKSCALSCRKCSKETRKKLSNSKMGDKNPMKRYEIRKKSGKARQGTKHCFYGKKRPEHSEKMKGNQFAKNRQHSEKSKTKISNSMKGKNTGPKSEKTKKKVSISRKGKCCGSNNPNWKGKVTVILLYENQRTILSLYVMLNHEK